MSGRRVLYVHGMESRVTVRDLVHEFERYNGMGFLFDLMGVGMDR